jgi:penicillin amidase
MRTRARKIALIAVAGLAGLAVVGTIGALIAARATLGRSRPILDGSLVVAGPKAEIRIERDAHGVPTIRASDREDLAFGLGFLHAQERFFQMDLLRRSASAELAELLGPGPGNVLVNLDRQTGRHRFRPIAREAVALLDPISRRRLEAYTRGVNVGLGELSARPFEYVLLGSSPRFWLPEDSILVVHALFLNLQGDQVDIEMARRLVRESLPEPLARFLTAGIDPDWDAPILDGPVPAPPPIPGPEVLDLRESSEPEKVKAALVPRASRLSEPLQAGSNVFAVAGSRTADGRAWLANDMHLQLGVPNIWYRAVLVVPDGPDGVPGRAMGATLPGGPGLVVGSNGKVAWGLTNTGGDWCDLIDVGPIPAGSPYTTYQTPDGPTKEARVHVEPLRIKGEATKRRASMWTEWGPVVGQDTHQHRLAARWIAHDPKAVDLGVVGLAESRTLEELLDRANRAGGPQLNLMAADANGRIGWTITGRVPDRSDPSRPWTRYLDPAKSPRVIDPPSGYLWNANARPVGEPELALFGDAVFDRGARGMQVRDDLARLESARPSDLLAIQLDDRAVFLARWKDLLLRLLTDEAVANDPRRKALRAHLVAWDGTAGVNAVGYRIVHEFRQIVVPEVLSPLIGADKVTTSSNYRTINGLAVERPVWALLSQRPAHLLPPSHKSWDALLLACVDRMLADESPDGSSLAAKTWGEMNTLRITHPMSGAIPGSSSWLDMPATPAPGGWSDMPRIQAPNYGASERMVVSPGAEDRSIFHMPGGQSGHPLEPTYRDGHDDWAQGRPSPLEPGPTLSTLVLRPRPTR